MTVIADLHVHSTASDGQYTPSEVVKLAKDRGIEVLALTDHDTPDGLEEAVKTGRELNVNIIPGIELGAREYHTFHILGYNFDPAAPELTALSQELKAGRDERGPRIVSYLRGQGIDISLSEAERLAGGSILGRPHFAQVLTQRGYVSSNREAFERYLDTNEFYRCVERPKPPVKTCVECIKAAGGKVSLAHPYQIGVSDKTLATIVQELIGYGLDAIECYYPKHTLEQQAFYLWLVEESGLHVTGGSDFHGEKIKPDTTLAALEMELDWLFQ